MIYYLLYAPLTWSSLLASRTIPQVNCSILLMQTDEEKGTKVSFLRLLNMNSKEWPYVVVGVLCAAATGSVMPLFADLLGSVIAAMRPSEPSSKILKFCILFWSLGAAQLLLGSVQACTRLTSACCQGPLLRAIILLCNTCEHRYWWVQLLVAMLLLSDSNILMCCMFVGH